MQYRVCNPDHPNSILTIAVSDTLVFVIRNNECRWEEYIYFCEDCEDIQEHLKQSMLCRISSAKVLKETLFPGPLCAMTLPSV